VALTLASCAAAGSTAPTPAATTPPVPSLLASAGLRLPVQDYLPTEEQQWQLTRARLVLIRQCMRGFGLEYHVEPVSSAGYGPRSLTDRRYGITDSELAHISGYGLGARDPAKQPQPAKPDVGPEGTNVLTGQGQSVVRGTKVPDGGCMAQAERDLDRSAPAGADANLGQKLQFQSYEASKQDSQVRTVTASWSACMAKAGYQYADPIAAAGDPAFEGTVNPAQIAVAEADIRCKGETNLVGVWFTVESAYQRHQIDQNAGAYAAVKEAIATRQQNAKAAAPPG
jgi:hypothetical protein